MGLTAANAAAWQTFLGAKALAGPAVGEYPPGPDAGRCSCGYNIWGDIGTPGKPPTWICPPPLHTGCSYIHAANSASERPGIRNADLGLNYAETTVGNTRVVLKQPTVNYLPG